MWPGLEASAALLAPQPPGWGGNLLRGAGASLVIALGAFGLGALIGIGGALGKLGGGPVTRDLLAVYTTVVRAVPELILILLLYYAGTDLLNQALALLGYRPVEISGLVAGIGVLGVVQGAYATEVLRGAIQAVPRGQTEAAEALGLHARSRIFDVVLPQAFKLSLPATVGFLVQLLKGTSLAAIVGFIELSRAGLIVSNQIYRPLLVYGVVGVMYFAMCWPLSLWGRYLERRMSAGTAS